MGIPENVRLHQIVTASVKFNYRRYPKLYVEYRIRKEYLKRGGQYVEETIDDRRARHLLERWVEIIPFLKQGRVVDCTAKTLKSKASRPLHRLDHDTPLTLPELLDCHEKADILKMARRANKNPDKRVRWLDLVFDDAFVEHKTV